MNKTFLGNIFGRKPSAQSPEWRTDQSIFNFILSQLDTDGNLQDPGVDLPDEEREENKLKFAAGLADAMFGPDDSEASGHRITELARLLKRVAETGDQPSEYAFYKQITQNDSVVGIVDAFLQRVVEHGLPVEPWLSAFARDLATKSSHRNAVKFGIAILGVCDNKLVLRDLKVLGAHDEFTVFVAVALSRISTNPGRDLWDLARNVEGWGRIQVVDRMANLELEDEIRDWLIREGYKNSIMYEYLAFTCATAGQLHVRLESENIDSTLFKSSGEIITALINGGPAEDISAYVYARSVIEDYLRHAQHHVSTLSDFLVLHKIKGYLLGQEGTAATANKVWTDDIISNRLIEISALLNSRDWTQLAMEGLKSSDNATYWNAKRAAEILGIDLWNCVWDRLLKNPLDGASWYDVTHYAKPEKADQIVDCASECLPLKELATGPEESMGLGETYQQHHCLEYVITFLGNHTGKGELLLLTALNSPVIRNRNMAINALAKWKEENWSSDIRAALNHLKDIEPVLNTRKNIERLLNGQEPDWSVNVVRTGE